MPAPPGCSGSWASPLWERLLLRTVTVAPGPRRRRSRRPRSGPGRSRSAGDGEGGAQARDLEDLAGRGLEPPQLDAATALAGPLQRPDEHAEAGRVDEVHPGEVDDDLAGALLDQPV